MTSLGIGKLFVEMPVLSKFIGLGVAIFCCWVAPHTHALGRNIDAPYLYQHRPEAIDSVMTCGSWQNNAKAGHYRITHAVLFSQSFLYVDWVSMDMQGSYALNHHLTFPQINNDHANISLERISCVELESGIEIAVEAYFAHEDKVRKVPIKVGERFGEFYMDLYRDSRE